MARLKSALRKAGRLGLRLWILGLAFVWVALHLMLRSQSIVEPYAIAHRGGGGLAPENTMAAVRAAIARGDSSVEIDVRRTSDGVLVVMHDDDLERTTDGRGLLDDLTWDQLRVLDAGGHYSADYAGERVPSLKEVLAAIAGTRTTLFVEAKNPSSYPGIERQIAEVVRETALQEQVVVLSFDHSWLAAFQEIAPTIRAGRLSTWNAAMAGAQGLSIMDVHWGAVLADPTLVRRVHRNGFEVAVWTVNNPRLMRLMLWLGVDGITTDYPDAWVRATDARQ